MKDFKGKPQTEEKIDEVIGFLVKSYTELERVVNASTLLANLSISSGKRTFAKSVLILSVMVS